MLLTRAPVAGGSASTPPLPLDLHVLSLPLAFILSQDQTLRCYIFCLSTFLLSVCLSGRLSFIFYRMLTETCLTLFPSLAARRYDHSVPPPLSCGIMSLFSSAVPAGLSPPAVVTAVAKLLSFPSLCKPSHSQDPGNGLSRLSNLCKRVG